MASGEAGASTGLIPVPVLPYGSGFGKVSRHGRRGANEGGVTHTPLATLHSPYTPSNARSTSFSRSATSSTPQLSRTMPSVMPSCARRSGGTDAWVMDAG